MSVAVDASMRVLGGRFQLVRRLGAGAFGTVYEAEDVDHKQRIAVKQLHVLDPDSLYRFKQEFRSAADITHPNIVGLKELFSADGHWYMTMELVDGVDFRAWIRGDGPLIGEFPDDREETRRWKSDHPPDVITASYTAAYDEARLRRCLAQLTEAVHALHRHNVLHRDLKPSNVMIDGDERLRVLDYGLAAPLGREGLHTSSDELVVGTPGYMSPEQAEGVAIAAASDWYSVGAMLFEALTGRLPFEGAARDVLWKKVHEDGPDPRTHDRDLPADLAEVCHGLLKKDPAARLRYEDLIGVVGRTRARSEVPVFAGDTVFVGRTYELEQLRRAAERATERSVVVHVQGPSGVGKSALVRRFVEDIERSAVVLAGRCFERESVPFKALDSLVDALTQHLRGLPRSEVDALVPAHAAALARVFPVLTRLESFADARITDRVTDPNEIRRRAATALRELLGRLAKRRPLVLWIDDLQWGDADSAVLFRELVALPDPPAMMLVLGYRSEDAAAEMVAAVRGRRSTDQWVELAIQPLGASEAEELATALLGNSTDARRVANESGGVPFFVHELARTVTSGMTLANLSLADVLGQRMASLPAKPRRLLDVVAASGGPITHRVARTAAGSGLDELILLRAARFLRSRGDGDDDLVECFHDRIRETALANLAEPAATHRAIAEALEREPVPDPEAIVEQFRAAGDAAQTLLYAERAADLAEHKLAFDRAVDLYALALQLASPGRRQYFAVCYAEALANAGRGAAAAAAFRTAADGATGDDQVRLRTRSAEQFLRSGLVDEGIEQLQPALAHLALRLPGSPRSALVTLLARRLRLKLRGLAFTETRDEVPAAKLHRIDLCWSVGNGLGGVDMVRAATFQAQHLLLALEAGEPYRVSRAIAWESIVRSMEGGPQARRRARELGETAKAIAERISHPHARAWAAATEAIAAECEGRWRDAQRHSTVTIALFREAQTDVAWEVGSMYAWWLLPALYMAGDLVELAERTPRAAADADAVGDLYTATSLRTYLIPRMHLIAGNVERADAERANAIGKWSRAGWHLQHWADVSARAEIALYRGDGAAAVRAWDAERGQLRASLLMRMCMLGIQTRYSLGRALVLAGEPALVKRAATCARELGAFDTAWAKCFGKTLDAGVAMRRGDRERALALLATVAADYREIDMQMHAHACDHVRGRTLGGDTGHQLVAAAETWMREHDVAEPAALASSFVPGF
ncbi:MAG TPA: protein kinase [Kofleriaceae bacterium]|nr:protein kinase [Kofleriaceae bacterium]